MDKSNSAVAQQLARAASAFEQGRTGHVPKSVSVVLNEETLVITLRGALSPAETAKLFWQLPGLDALSAADRLRAYRDVGGHPRTLEYLELTSGKA